MPFLVVLEVPGGVTTLDAQERCGGGPNVSGEEIVNPTELVKNLTGISLSIEHSVSLRFVNAVWLLAFYGQQQST